MATMAPINKSVKLGRGKSKRRISQNAAGFERAPPAGDVRRDSESSDEYLERVERTLKVDIQGLSALHVACLQGQLGSIQLMLDSGMWWINSSDDSEERRPLHMFLGFQRSPQALTCLRYLLQQGADVNLTSESGQTPLHMAVAEGLMDYTKILVEAGADLFARDNFGLTPLDMARIRNHRKIGRYLKDCMWQEKKRIEFKERKQTQALYCELMDCVKQDNLNKKTKIDKNVAEWAKKKGMSLRKEFSPKVLVRQFHKQCLISDKTSSLTQAKKAESKCSQQRIEGPQEGNSASSESPPESPSGQQQEGLEKDKGVSLKLPPVSKSRPWVIYTAPEPDSPLVEPDLRGKVRLWRDSSSNRPQYRTKWDRTRQEAPSLPIDTIQRVLFPRDFPPRIPSLGHFKPKDIQGVQQRGCPQGRSTSPWTEVAMHLAEELEPGHY